MRRWQIKISIDDRLLAGIRFAAQRDGLAPSVKARSILTQALSRTMATPEFARYWEAISPVETDPGFSGYIDVADPDDAT